MQGPGGAKAMLIPGTWFGGLTHINKYFYILFIILIAKFISDTNMAKKTLNIAKSISYRLAPKNTQKRARLQLQKLMNLSSR